MTFSVQHVVTETKTFRYEVHKTRGLFSPDNPGLAVSIRGTEAVPAQAFVVVDRNVSQIYGSQIEQYFASNAIDAYIHTADIRERGKQMASVLEMARLLSNFRLLRRQQPLVAIGGGVLLDVCGFTASIYRRGIPYIRIPTTLMAYVDAGIGVKTGVNLETRKSRLGTYFPPRAVFLDRFFLTTLSPRHIANGLAEVIKLALMKSADLFERLERVCPEVLTTKFQSGELEDGILDEAVGLMLQELSGNLWEDELERCVDFGHSFSPALEMLDDCKLLHGEAVAFDMALCLVIAEMRGYLSTEQSKRVLTLLANCRLLEQPIALSLPVLVGALADAAIHRNGAQRLPLPVGIGSHTFVHDVTSSELALAATRLTELLGRVAESRVGESPAYLQ